MVLDTKLDFNLHLKNLQSKLNKTIWLLRKLLNILPRKSLIIIYKTFIRPHLDYGNIIYDRAYNSSFYQNIESIQYNSALTITDAVRGISKEKLYLQLGFESLQQRRWYRKLCCFSKIIKNNSPSYLFQLVPYQLPDIWQETPIIFPNSHKTKLILELLFSLNYKWVEQSGPRHP